MNTDIILKNFERSCIIHGDATESGDYKTANKHHQIIIKSILQLYNNGDLMKIENLLNHKNVSVKLWSAGMLLPFRSSLCEKILKEISKANGMVSFSAEITLQEWKKGTLKLPYKYKQ